MASLLLLFVLMVYVAACIKFMICTKTYSDRFT